MAGKFQQFFNTYIWETDKRLGQVVTPYDNPRLMLDNVMDFTRGGRSVSTESAMTLSAVYRAVAIKAGFISSLPFQVFQKTDRGRVLANHPVSYLLSRKPNNKVSKVVYFDRAMQHYEFEGNHYALIRRNGIGRVEAYDLLHPKNVEVLEGDNQLIYEVTSKGKKVRYGADDIIHVPNMGDGYVGKSVLRFMKEDAGLMMDVRDYGESFFGRGGKPAGLLLPKSVVTPAQRQETKKSFQEAKEQGGEVAMPYGWEYKEISVPPAEAEWVTTNNFSISTVARWFGVPTQKLGDSAIKYSNVEFMGIEFLQDTMAPIASKFETEYTNKSFQLSTEQDLYCEFNLDAYLRADSISKAESISKQVQNALMTPNEGRKLYNLDSKEGGDELFIQGATVPLSMQKEMLTKKQPAARQSLRQKIEKQVKEGLDPQLIIEGLFGNDSKGYE
jgi:HK97 family phage portal protein